jgi:hypothetical protein
MDYRRMPIPLATARELARIPHLKRLRTLDLRGLAFYQDALPSLDELSQRLGPSLFPQQGRWNLLRNPPPDQPDPSEEDDSPF